MKWSRHMALTQVQGRNLLFVLSWPEPPILEFHAEMSLSVIITSWTGLQVRVEIQLYESWSLEVADSRKRSFKMQGLFSCKRQTWQFEAGWKLLLLLLKLAHSCIEDLVWNLTNHLIQHDLVVSRMAGIMLSCAPGLSRRQNRIYRQIFLFWPVDQYIDNGNDLYFQQVKQPLELTPFLVTM